MKRVDDKFLFLPTTNNEDENPGITLNEARKNHKTFGACTRDMLIHVRKATSDEFPQ